MTPQDESKDAPLRDIFATQGILVVLICIGVFALHLWKPEYCRDLLTEWHRIASESPEAAGIIRAISEWFASICSG